MVKEASLPFQLCSSVSASSGTFTSSATSIIYRDTLGYQLTWSGSLQATAQVNVSLDYNPGLPQSAGRVNPGGWVTLASVSISSGTPQPVTFNLNQLAAPWSQFQVVNSSGTGVITLWTTAKSLG